MKKFLASLLSVLLVAVMVAVPASALTWEDNQVLGDDGNYTFDNAYGYVFNIGSVNGKIGGEDVTLITTADAYNASNPNWAISVLLAPTSEANVYEVALAPVDCPQSAAGGIEKGINFDNGNICLIAHSAYSNPNGANWEAKVAAMALKVGDKITLAGIDLTAGTATDATATVEDDPADKVPTGPVITEDKTLSVGKSYTTTAPNRNDKWDDDGKKLTDGVIADATTAELVTVTSAWNNPGKAAELPNVVEVIIDLEEAVLSNSYTIHLAGGTWGISAPTSAGSPTSFEVFAADSADGDYTSVATANVADMVLTNGTGAEASWSTYSLTAKAATPVEARFIKIVITVQPVGNAFVWANEVEVKAVKTEGGSSSVVVKEEITVDGDLSDNGWAEDGWTEVTPDNGYWQSIPTTDTLTYKYQLRTDDTKLYAAFEIDCAAVEGGNGKGTNVRFWLNSDDEATVYTHFYDVFVGGTGAKYNQAKDKNDGAAIENSSINAVLTPEGEKTYVEFSIDLAEFNGAEGFNYFVCVSNKINENVCLYIPAVDVGAEDNRLANLPYNNWDKDNQATVDVEEIKLGEIVIEGGNDDEEKPKEDIEAKMKELLGQAPADAKVDYVIEAPESYKAGDEITVTVTVKNITAENGIHVAAFKLLYDNEKLLLTNDLDEEDENALLCVKTLPKDWENLSSVANDYNADNEEGTVVNPLNDGVINVSVFTAKSSASAAIKEDGALVLEFTFKALEDAEGDIGLVIPHADAECAFNGKNGEEVYAANGSYAVIKAPVVEEESKPGDDPVKPGDASSMIIFAIIALVAIAGSAVVVKTRR